MWHTSQPAWLTLSSKLSRHYQVHSQACSHGRSQLLSIAHSNLAWLYALKMLSSTLPRTLSRMLPTALDGTLPACMSVISQVSSHEALKHSPKHALMETPNCTRLHSQPDWLYASNCAPKTLSSTLPRTLSSALPIALYCTLPTCFTVRSQVSSQYTPKYTSQSLSSTLPIALDGTLPISHENMLPCMLLHARSRDLLSFRCQAPGGVRLGAYGMQCLLGGG